MRRWNATDTVLAAGDAAATATPAALVAPSFGRRPT
jgi:hypothetical protein